MTTYRIENLTSGADLGAYEASSKDEALEMMARDAGYTSYAEACEVAGEADLCVTEEGQSN